VTGTTGVRRLLRPEHARNGLTGVQRPLPGTDITQTGGSGPGIEVAGMARRRLALAVPALAAAVIPALLAAPQAAAWTPSHHDKVAIVASNLRGLAAAEEAYYTGNGAYTDSIAAAQAAGYAPYDNTDVHVVWYDARGYCLSGEYVSDSSTQRSYDSLKGGMKGRGFDCTRHAPRDATS
jgi:hypothetical protein